MASNFLPTKELFKSFKLSVRFVEFRKGRPLADQLRGGWYFRHPWGFTPSFVVPDLQSGSLAFIVDVDIIHELYLHGANGGR